jgi:hypothetical protein
MDSKLTPDSLSLIKFLDSIKSKKCVPGGSLNDIYNHIIDVYKEVDKTKISIKGSSSQLDNSHNIVKYLDNNKKILSKIKALNYCKVLNINNGKALIKLYHNDKLSNRTIINIIKRTIILSLIHNIDNPININLFMIDLKKRFPNKLKSLGTNDINSGVTTMSYFDKHDRDVSIFRIEEYKKLIIHELIHYLDLDFKDTCTADFSKHFNISPTISIKLYESYTEVCANIINCILSSYEVNNRKNKATFNKFICYEIKFSLFQIAKILLFYKFKNISDFIKPYDGKDRFKQTTPVLSYFFIKSALLYNLSSFSKFLYENCELFKFKTTQDKYVELVLELCKNKKFLNSIQEYMDYIQKHKLSSFIKNTMRMTCIECL